MAAPELDEREPEVEAGLCQVRDEVRRLSASGLPLLAEPVARVVDAQHDRLRSELALTAALAVGGRIDDRVVVAAAAVELVHAASLAGEGCWGVFLVARASAAALWVSREVAEELAVAATDVIEGQCRDLADAYDANRSERSALLAVELKAGTLFRAACAVAARCAGARDSDLERIAEFGARFGTAFQLIDDLLDLVGEPEVLGRPVGNDLRRGVYTVPLLHALRADPDLRALLAARGRLLTDSEIDGVRARLRWGTLVTDTLARCDWICGEALDALPELADERAARALRALPLAYLGETRSLIRDCRR